MELHFRIGFFLVAVKDCTINGLYFILELGYYLLIVLQKFCSLLLFLQLFEGQFIEEAGPLGNGLISKFVGISLGIFGLCTFKMMALAIVIVCVFVLIDVLSLFQLGDFKVFKGVYLSVQPCEVVVDLLVQALADEAMVVHYFVPHSFPDEEAVASGSCFVNES